jgi:hypothetical protein
MKRRELAKRIDEVRAELAALGPLHPGSISQQYNVCGNPGCRCKDPENPKKHGPYYQLSYTWRGKHTTRFVRAERLEDMERKVANHKRLRELTQEWIDLSVALERAADDD